MMLALLMPLLVSHEIIVLYLTFLLKQHEWSLQYISSQEKFNIFQDFLGCSIIIIIIIVTVTNIYYEITSWQTLSALYKLVQFS